MVEINHNPSPREIRIFGLLWLVFFAAVGGVALWKPEGLVGASIFLAAAWLVALILNRANRGRQMLGALMPLLFAAVGVPVGMLGVPALRVAAVVWAFGVLGALAIWVAPGLGRRLYVGWMLAAAPIGWTISHLVLALVFYLVLTPIGLIMRLVGYDPMRRRFDPEVQTYWIERKGTPDTSRYFRQF